MNDQPYLFAERTPRVYPLQDHLPEYRAGVVSACLSETLPRGSWVISPFGSSPQIALEAARSGYKVVLPVHNPILRFLIDTLADPPSREDLNEALASLAASYKGKERLRPLILGMYETDCPHCGAPTSAVSFRWLKSTKELVRKTCRCAACGEESVSNVTAEDIHKASGFSDRSLIHARALTRVTSPNDPIRIQVENALASYPPRSVYALFTILNKLAGFDLPEEKLSHLEILLLHAFYRCSQPLSLALADHTEKGLEDDTYQEENVWFVLEEALEIWSGTERAVPVTVWPEPPAESGGICIYPGRIKELINQLAGTPLKAVVMVFPKPTPTFWGLSALWTGWLWGQEAAAPLRGILSARTYDWTWMTRAVESTLTELGRVLPDGTPLLGLIPETETASLLSGTSAALNAGLKLENIALDPDQRLVQTRWNFTSAQSPAEPPGSSRELIRSAGYDLLQKSGEPRHNLAIYAAGLARLAEGGFYQKEERSAAEKYFPRLQVDFEENIAYRQGFLHYPGIENWWHLKLELSPLPHSDRIEKALVTLLVKAGGPLTEEQLYSEIYRSFPALDTPRTGLLQACLTSYGKKTAENPRTWTLKSNEQPARRKKDLQEMEVILREITIRLGLTASQASAPENIIHLVWEDENGPSDSFFISVSGLLNKIITAQGAGARRNWIILPGSRAELIHYKMGQNPLLAEIIGKDWGLVKFRHLRRLAEQGDLTRDNFLERINLDPFTSDSPQLLLI